MYRLRISHQGSALIIGLVVVILLTILTTSFLEKVLNLGKTSSGINNSAQSYSLATGLIEEQLMDSAMTKQSPWNIAEKVQGTMVSTGRSLRAFTGGMTMPSPGKGNSAFSKDWNTIGVGEPLQIVIPSGMNWGSVYLYFRVPSIPGETNATGSTSSSGILLWTYGFSGASLYASGETNIFKLNDITGAGKQITSYQGKTNTGVDMSFSMYDSIYGNSCAAYQCTLKLSMIRPFVTDMGKSYSFLEYKIDFPKSIPSQYMVIDSSAYIYGYFRSRQVRIPQITTNTVTDFAILQ